MEKERTFRNVLIGVLCITVFCMSIGFAYMSQRLEINGTLNVEEPTWDIHFTSITPGTPIGTAVSNSATLTNNNHKAVFDVTLKNPGDSVAYTLTVQNTGTLSGTVSDVAITPTTGTTVDIPENITVTSSGISTGDIIAGSGSQTFVITFTYRSDITDITPATNDSPITYTATIDYVQTH